MKEDINEPVSVITIFDASKGKTIPTKVKWKNRTYIITETGFHHIKKKGETIHHLYSVISVDLFLLLDLNTDTLEWELVSIDTAV